LHYFLHRRFDYRGRIVYFLHGGVFAERQPGACAQPVLADCLDNVGSFQRTCRTSGTGGNADAFKIRHIKQRVGFHPFNT
jgi:hypothetical protein